MTLVAMIASWYDRIVPRARCANHTALVFSTQWLVASITRQVDRRRPKRSVSWITTQEVAADRGSDSRRLVLADDRADPLAAKRRLQQMRLGAVDNLEALDQTPTCQQVE